MNGKKTLFLLIGLLIFLQGSLMAKNTDKINIDLVDISAVDATIVIDLKYADIDNIFGRPLYDENTAHLRKSTAEKLAAANNKLKQKGLGLKVWDAYRPLFVQRMMWKLKPDANFVADPKKASEHNKGCAVDLTLVDKDGNEVPMPTKFDDFSAKAKADYKNLPGEVIANRETLKEALMSSGFSQYKNEWWHFADTDSKKFAVLNVSFEKLASSKAQKMQAKKDEKEAKKDEKQTKNEGPSLIFDLSAVKEGLDFLGAMPLYKKGGIDTYQGITVENQNQQVYLKINQPNIVLFNDLKYELTLMPAKEIADFKFFINNELVFPRGWVFSLMGRVEIRSEEFSLKCRGLSWQQDGAVIKIKIFRWK